MRRRRHSFCLVGCAGYDSSLLERHELHGHIGWKEVNRLWSEGFLQPLSGDGSPYLFEWLIPGRVIRFKRRMIIRDLSSRFGEVIERAVRNRETWAMCWLSLVQMR
jgi:hypothetical protein